MRLRFLQYLPNQFCLLAVLLLPNTVIGQLEPIDSEVKASYGTAPAALDHSTQTALLSQIDTAIKRLKAVRATRGGTSESSSLDLALNMLELSKAQVLGKLSAKDAEPQLANAMEAVQTQINHLRIIAANSPNSELLLGQLRQTQDRLDFAKNQFKKPAKVRDESPETIARVESIFQRAQERLDQARMKALLQPNNTAVLQNLDDAQTQLDTARLSYETRGDTIQ